MVEYILLLAVSVSLVMTFYNSDAFKKLFGDQGELGKQIKARSEYSYRHASANGNTDFSISERDGSTHPSYYDETHSETHFFGAKNAYP